MEMNKELLAKAKETKTPEELMAFAKENNMEMTEESAKAYFDLIHPKTGDIPESELDNVSGGGCHADDGREIVTVGHGCTCFVCKKCGNEMSLQALALCSANAAAWRYATTANTAHTKKDCGFATKIATEKTKTYFCGLI